MVYLFVLSFIENILSICHFDRREKSHNESNTIEQLMWFRRSRNDKIRV